MTTMPNSWVPGEKLFAADLNANFSSLVGDVTSLDAGVFSLDASVSSLDALTEFNASAYLLKQVVYNFGFTLTLDSPATGDIRIAMKQGDGVTDCTASGNAVFGFADRETGLALAASKTLDMDKTDHLGLDDYAANWEATLFLYAIDRAGALEFGIGRRADYSRATADFVNTIGTATTRNKVFCSAAITAGDRCWAVGYFKATYNTTTPDWDSVTADSEDVGSPPSPDSLSIPKAWINVDGTTAAVTIRDSYNVTSITDEAGLGTYTITWDTDFADTNYSIVSMAGKLSGSASITANIRLMSAGSCRILTYTSAPVLIDAEYFGLVAFGR